MESKYFKLEELTKTNTGLDNIPTEGVKIALQKLVTNVLDKVRELYGKPITVNSGYRSPAVNKKVGGSSTSGHLLGTCADVTGGSIEENKKIFKLIKDNCEFRQLINEHNYSWIHVEYRENDNKQQLLEAVKENGKTTYKNMHI